MTPLFLYTVLTVLFSPFIYGWLWIRKAKGKENKDRFSERFGYPSQKRPKGKLVWMHGASVGECLSMLPLINKILKEEPKTHVLVTSGTVTSAELMQKRLPERAMHQFVPVDLPWGDKRFVTYWKPDVVLWFESDFWPNLLYAIHKTRAPMALVNGRISDNSYRRWGRALFFIKPILSFFTVTLGMTQEDARRLSDLGAKKSLALGNLKYAADMPPFDPAELKRLQKEMGHRPRFCFAATHAGEEEIMADIYRDLKKKYPALLGINIPKHPRRGDEVEAVLKSQKLTVARRSRGEKITPKTDIYIADTIGEMGLLYQLAPVVFVGGSLIKFGGQNMLEPMRLGRAVLIGPHAFNFREIVAFGKVQKALVEVADEKELKNTIADFLNHPKKMADISVRAAASSKSLTEVLPGIYGTLEKEVGL
ncbi:MAG: 3-deoxy-D-manno-octulosonic acid transferase [Lactobacillales bacterium]|jgi:3-deoxy-D-manno-octulosonic-acid transferase|nr:3-deoxy-D-manno-octulosonic acid transferase [Lactobacillales bacterium]